jgi:uncharacterized protein (AIM24 family)
MPPKRALESLPLAHHGGWTVPPSAEATSIRAEEAASHPDAATPLPFPPGTPSATAAAPPLAHLARTLRLVFPTNAGAVLHSSGVALVRTTAGEAARPFAARLEAIRLHHGTLATEGLPRQTRGKSTGESFGGVASPLGRISGDGELVVAPRPSHTILSFTLADEAITLREDILLGFDLVPIAYENERLALGDGESAQIARLNGTGVVLLELRERIHAIQVSGDRPIFIRRDSVLGWTGTIAPRPLPPGDAPSGQRGLLEVAGDGIVLVASS